MYIFQLVSQCQRELVSLCCLFRMEVGNHLDRPNVVELINVNEYHLREFEKR